MVVIHQKSQAKDAEQQILAYERFMELLGDYQTRQVLRYDAAGAAVFENLRLAKVRIGTLDLRIAAIVLSRNATLLSRNLRDFHKVPGLHVEDWTQ